MADANPSISLEAFKDTELIDLEGQLPDLKYDVDYVMWEGDRERYIVSFTKYKGVNLCKVAEQYRTDPTSDNWKWSKSQLSLNLDKALGFFKCIGIFCANVDMIERALIDGPSVDHEEGKKE